MNTFIKRSIRILLIWLIFQFFAHTLVTYERWRDASWLTAIRARKEIMIVLLWIVVIYDLTKNKRRHMLRNNTSVRFFFFLFIFLVLVSAGLTFFVHNQSIREFVLAFKYDYFWFAIALIIWLLWIWQDTEDGKKITDWYVRVIKWLLVWGLIRWMIIAVKPWATKFFWYDVYSREWTIWRAPPAAYYTGYHVNTWYTRNQFLFERPLSRWFFLIAFFPLFFLWELRHKPFSVTWIWRLLYALNIITTFSRAARWAWIIQIVLLIAIVYRKQLWYYAIRGLLPLLLGLWVIAYIWQDQIINRTFSNTWHLKETRKWAIKASMHPWAWRWAAFAWPWSHQTATWIDYNPENQFLQIAIEFGIPVAFWWFLLFSYFIYVWIIPVRKKKTFPKKNTMEMILLAVAIWMIGLAIEWMVLHSFSDRMVVYPLMIIAGMGLGSTIWRRKNKFNK